MPFALRRLVILATSEIYTAGVVALVTDDAGRVLILKHSYRPLSPWGLPAGTAQRGERFEQTLRREFAEETGWTLGPARLLAVFHWRRPPELQFLYQASIEGGAFRANAEITDVAWITPEELTRRIGRPHQRLARFIADQLAAAPASSTGSAAPVRQTADDNGSDPS